MPIEPPQQEFSSLPEERRVSLKEVQDKWNAPQYGEDITVPYDWNSKVLTKMKDGDVNGMKAAALPTVQYEVIRLAHEAKNEQTRLQAAQTVLGQMGHGPISRIEHTMNYEQMPTDQLTAAIASRLARVIKLNPNIDLTRIIEAAQLKAPESTVHLQEQEAIEAEFEPA